MPATAAARSAMSTAASIGIIWLPRPLHRRQGERRAGLAGQAPDLHPCHEEFLPRGLHRCLRLRQLRPAFLTAPLAERELLQHRAELLPVLGALAQQLLVALPESRVLRAERLLLRLRLVQPVAQAVLHVLGALPVAH